jgi:hypothetical protein
MAALGNFFHDPLEVGQRPPVGIAVWVWSDFFLLLAVLLLLRPSWAAGSNPTLSAMVVDALGSSNL